MELLVLGLDDAVPGPALIDWVIERALSRPVGIRLVTELDTSDPDAAKVLLVATSQRIEAAAPGTSVESVLIDRPFLLHELLEQSESADVLVIGSHPDPGMRDGRTPSFPVTLAARSRCPVVVVPDDWQPRGGPVVVGVDAAGASFEAAVFAAREAVAADRELDIVTTWEPWTALKTRTEQFAREGILGGIVDRIRAEFPSVRARGVLREAVAHDGIIASSPDAYLVVLGTHRLGQESGVVLGAIHQELMIRGGVALCIVPLADAPTDHPG